MALVPTDEDELGVETTCRCGCQIVRCRGVRTSWMHTDTRSEECWDKALARPLGPNEWATS